MVDQLITSISERLNLDASPVRQGVATLLRFIQEKVPGETSSALIEKIPGASALLQETPEAPSEGGGLLGGLMGAASSMMGGQAGAVAEISAKLEKSGIPLDKIPGFLDVFKEKAIDLAGPETMNSLLGLFGKKE